MHNHQTSRRLPAFKLTLGATLFSILAVGAFAQMGRPDQIGGHASDHILVRFKSGQVPKPLGNGSLRTGNARLDQLTANWT
ncbi:MAG: hypothetical protein H0W86_06695, partial [Armatimonadetes bacterium]|nr:hypothetical protein [Armatimonadota bacterium]